MAMDTFKNLAYGVVLLPPTPPNLGTSLTLASGHGARFPAAPFNISIWPFGVPADPVNCEIARCTGRANDVLTIQRQQEGTQLRTILVGDAVAQAMTAKAISDLMADLRAYTDQKDALMKQYVDNLDAAQRTYLDSRDNAVAAQSLLRHPRTWNVQTAATPVNMDVDLYDQTYVYQQATPLTMGNTTGTAFEGQGVLVRIRDSGVAIPISWSSVWMSATSVPLPTATVALKTLSVAFRFNGLYAKWQMLAVAQEP
jgi:hypothetical protein